MFRYRFFKAAGVAALVVSIFLCSGCTAVSSDTLLPSAGNREISSVLAESEEVENSNQQLDLIAARRRKESLLGKPGYCYGTLSDEEKIVYEQLYEAVTGFQKSRVLDTTDSELIRRVYNHMIADHPEIFWVEGYTINTMKRGSNILSVEFSMKQTMKKKEVAAWQETIGSYLDKFTKAAKKQGITKKSGDYDILRFTFDYIVKHTEYKENVKNNQNICSVFGSGYSVCQGYSVAMQYLLQYQGIPCVTVSGVTKDTKTNHAWNMVKVDGEWYYLDVTWGDPSFLGDEKASVDIVNYAYFCVTGKEISKTHIVGEELNLPECTSRKYNYFIYEKQYFEKWDLAHFKKLLKRCADRGEKMLSVRFGDQKQYQAARKLLIEEQNIFSVLEDCVGTANKVSYVENLDFYIVTFIWE
ncbi:MAG: transglutaminase domain-containing protein [Lachnospiraceae bacterium]|nr:transglutaminase domain-containing protein [Lachnospiraceae bacterium]